MHSHLERARETCLRLFGDASVRIEERGDVYERDIGEHLCKDVKRRIKGFEEALWARPEQRIVVVGHSSFFRHMTGSAFNNLDIWAFDFHGPGDWREGALLYPGVSVGAKAQHHA